MATHSICTYHSSPSGATVWHRFMWPLHHQGLPSDTDSCGRYTIRDYRLTQIHVVVTPSGATVWHRLMWPLHHQGLPSDTDSCGRYTIRGYSLTQTHVAVTPSGATVWHRFMWSLHHQGLLPSDTDSWGCYIVSICLRDWGDMAG